MAADPPLRPLYGRLMSAIRVQHEWGNRVRMLKLPLILTDDRLYGGAIANFYVLTRALEAALEEHRQSPVVAHIVESLQLEPMAPRYQADLEEIFGETWKVDVAAATRSAAVAEYLAALGQAGAIEVVAATFILYGALVVGGGKSTQAKVQRVFPRCQHVLFDVADDMRGARRRFKNAYTALGTDVAPEAADAVTEHVKTYMARNNAVVLSVRCLPFWWPRAAAAVAAVAVVAIGYRARGLRAGRQ